MNELLGAGEALLEVPPDADQRQLLHLLEGVLDRLDDLGATLVAAQLSIAVESLRGWGEAASRSKAHH